MFIEQYKSDSRRIVNSAAVTFIFLAELAVYCKEN